MGQIDFLYRLQQIDIELRDCKKRLTEVMALQKGDQRLREAQSAAEAAAAEAARWRRAQSEREQALAAHRRELAETQERLYSGAVRNPKELADLERKIEALTRRRATLEDELLEAMMAHEDAADSAAAADATLETVETERAAKMIRWRQEQHQLALAMDDWLTKRKKLVPRIEAGLLNEYQRTAQRRGGVAVAGLKGGVCQGCQVRVPAGVTAAANRGDLTHCSSCGRILNPL